MERFYLDKSEIIEADGPASIYIAGAEIIDAGVTINSMPVEYKDDEYQSYADNYDIHFIFDDDIPRVDFFTVPLVDIFATDSNGGFLGTIGCMTDFQSDAPICYIDDSRNCFIAAENGNNLIQKRSEWRNNLEKSADVNVFRTKADAEKNFRFISRDEIIRKMEAH